ncbi:phage baseplate assembly protein V [[Enterobacter] lignolyticus]|uniref:Baseplate assembly protein n=1 Tax=[Enterobacter] lignolyticus TaxID=1334193 RepID=A0A806X6V0_9ENTR|nr:phage baseplate assembly protein V [[Enterobacter] lignolyticus]ALR77760.1 baseplate assembly protein [[Enterobacter] lignolyticus]
MNIHTQIQDLARAMRNSIRTGIIKELDLSRGRCRVQTSGLLTDWLPWITHRAGQARSWWAPSVDEQVLVLAVGGELHTAFVLPGIFSDDTPAPSSSAQALHIVFPDGAIVEYDPQSSALKVTGIKTAQLNATESAAVTAPEVTVKATTRITLDTPEVICTQKLIAGTLEIQQGGKMSGDIEHHGGSLSSNGKVLHTHRHPGDSGGTTGAPL